MPPDDGDQVLGGEAYTGTLAEVASAGDQVKTLQQLRNLLAESIVVARSRGLYAEVSSLTGRLQSVLDRIAQLAPDTGKGTALDEFTKRRQARKTPRPAVTAKRDQRR